MIFSIIVPIFNVEKYLATCLESITKQSIFEYECILVNDESTDSSIQIAEKFCDQFSNFRLVHKKNGGLSDARNYGLSFATGDYIVFIDSDDFIHSNYLKKIKDVCTVYSPDLIYINYQRISEEYKDLDYIYPLTRNSSLISKDLLLQKPNFSWARIVKRSLYWKDPFPKGFLYEDIYVSTILASKSNKIYQIDEPLYAYRRREGSITNDSFANHCENMLKTVNLLWELVRTNNLEKKYYTGVLTNLTPSFAIVLIRNKSITKMKADADLVSAHFEKVNFVEYMKQTASIKNKFSAFILSQKFLNFYALLALRAIRCFSKKI